MRQFITKNSADIEICETICKSYALHVQKIIEEHYDNNPSFRLSVHLEKLAGDLHLTFYGLKKRSKSFGSFGTDVVSKERIQPFEGLHFWSNLLTKHIREMLKPRETFVVKQRRDREDNSFWIEITVFFEVYNKLRSDLLQ